MSPTDAPLHAQLSRFYALPVTAAIAAAITSEFADLETPDLCDAHLRHNRQYFGAIDKTLSGFVVLDNTGDDATLLDLRGDGRVWWQDHETRQVEVRFAHLQDYLAFQDARAQEPDTATDALLARFAPPASASPPSERPTSATLLSRWQWLVLALAQPIHDHDGVPLQDTGTLMRQAMGARVATFAHLDEEQALLAAELPQLANDPQLAAYWLLHTTISGQDAWRAQVLAAIGAPATALLQHLTARFGDLPDDAAPDVLPDLAERRAHLYWMLARHAGKSAPEAGALLRALLMAPHALTDTAGTDLLHVLDDAPDAVDANQALARIASLSEANRTAPALLAVRARLLAHLGQPPAAAQAANAATDALLHAQLAPLPLALLLMPISALVTRPQPFATLARQLLAWDNLSSGVLTIAEHAARLAPDLGLPTSAWFATQRALISELAPLRQAADDIQALRQAPAHLRQAMALRFMHRPELAANDAQLAWAFETLRHSSHPDAWPALCAACHSAPQPLRGQLLDWLGASIDHARHPRVTALLALLGALDGSDATATPPSEAMVDAIVQALAPWAEAAHIFDALMATLRSDGPGSNLLAARLERVYRGEDGIAGRLSADQAQQVFDWACARLAVRRGTHPDHVASRILRATAHPALWPALATQLSHSSARMAAGHATALDLLDPLYSMLGDAARQDEGQRALLLDRLWDETAYPNGVRMELGPLWTPGLHAQVMARLTQSPSPNAAANYASVLDGERFPDAPLVQLGLLVLTWHTPDDAHARAQLRYVLLAASQQAIRLHRPADLRALYARSQQWQETAHVPDHRPRPYAPFDTPQAQAALAQALTPPAPAPRRAAGALPKPDALARLAQVAFAFEWLRDRQAGIVLFQDQDQGVHYFDGQAIGAAPFTIDPTPDDSGPGLFHDVQTVDERLLLWKDADTLYDWTRFGPVIAAAHGDNNGLQARIALRFDSPSAAARFLDAVRRHPPAKYVAGDPWYHAGHGSVGRTLYVPGQSQRLSLALSAQQTWTDPDGITHHGQAAITAMDALEASVRRQGGFAYAVEALDDVRRPQDQSLAQWLTDQARPDDPPTAAALHARLQAIQAYLREHALPGGDALEIIATPPAAPAACQALQQASTTTLPQALLDLWQCSASLGWRLGEHGAHLLPPAQVMAGAIQAHGEQRRPLLVESGGAPLLMLRDACQAADRHVVAADDADGDDGWDCAEPDWLVHATLLGQLVRSICDGGVADARLLWHGQRGDAAVERLHLASASAFLVMRLDIDHGTLAIHRGKPGGTGDVTFVRNGQAQALRKTWHKAEAAALGKGMVPVADTPRA